MARDDPQINVRIPADLRDQLVKAANKSGRSLTAEIVQRLSASFVGYFGGEPGEDEELIGRLLETGSRRTDSSAIRRLASLSTALSAVIDEILNGDRAKTPSSTDGHDKHGEGTAKAASAGKRVRSGGKS